MNKNLKKGLVIALMVVVADQLHKTLMLHYFGFIEGKQVEVTSFFNLVMVWNYGISFGMFNNGSSSNAVILIIMSLAIVTFLLLWLKKSASKLQTIALGMVIGGALGNVIDRAIYGAVADFLDFHYFRHHWPAFNIADVAVSTGVFLLVVESFIDIRKK